ncbi:hypothetical protein [Corynebacterium sp. HMSC076D02]|uniref:hypothetical protein n=1 Tax=Corynebacterium sp. HMSC076D02 TaxID=1739439 RepID=UPI0008A2CA0C|nr:hypothetical protein [Corynebacterium sp. HMSC076D02]OFQ48119.1 hypothetical protein HMPREF2935_00840 [Corynebacterium sp. HMSC076D02]
MRPHKLRISPRGVTLDGLPLIHSEESPTIETILPNLHRVHLTIYAGHIQLDGDNHHTPEATPIYDQLKEEA